MNRFIKLLDSFDAVDCQLVFFADLNTMPSKQEEWLKRHNEDFGKTACLYSSLDRGVMGGSIKALKSSLYDMASVAATYGEFRYSVEHDNDADSKTAL